VKKSKFLRLRVLKDPGAKRVKRALQEKQALKEKQEKQEELVHRVF
jgi:hypothetical protein